MQIDGGDFSEDVGLHLALSFSDLGGNWILTGDRVEIFTKASVSY